MADEPERPAAAPDEQVEQAEQTEQVEGTATPHGAAEPTPEAAGMPATADDAEATPTPDPPAEPHASAEPDVPAEPGEPAEPDEPAEADVPAEPDVPAETPLAEQPEPEVPAQPAAPQPTDEAAPAEKAGTTDVAAPAEPAGSPVPKPPVPSPAALAPVAPAAPAAPAVPASDPSQWGRVAEDGTVYVRTHEGERPVGSYPATTADEALAYFGRKFDELAGQVTLLEARVAGGGVSLADAGSAIAGLRESVASANAVGDLAALLARLDGLTASVAKRQERREAEKAKARKRATAAKERIVVEAESLATSTEWKKTGDRLRELLEEWKKAARLDRRTDDALWKRFSAARTAFDRSRRTHFAELDEQRGDVAVRKEKLVKEAESLAGSKEWGETGRRFRDLMTQWKSAGRARRDVEDALWARFRAAQDTFFAARSEVFAARDADLAKNLTAKQSLLVEAEALLPVTDHRAARAAMRSIHERWEAAGDVPRADRPAVENRLRAVDDAVRGAEQSAWARSNPEARARAEDTVGQLRASIASLQAQAAQARAAGQDDKAAEAESAAATRATWLAEAEKTLAEFS